MYRLVVITILLLLSFVWIFPVQAQEPFEYLSPRPGAELVSAGSTIAVRHGDPIDAISMSQTLFTVMGSQSGPISGEVILADDQKTVIFKPIQPFKPAEIITVTIQPGLQTTTGETITGTTYQFTVSQIDLVTMQRLAIQQNRQRIGYDAPASTPLQAKGVFSHTLAQYATLPTDFPPITITTSANDTGDGYLFMTTQSLPFKPYGYMLIFDNQGEPVFYQKQPFLVADFKKQPTGQLSYCRFNLINVNLEDGICKLLDQTYTEVDTIQAGNGYVIDFHGVHVRPDGHVLLQIYDPQIYDMSQIVAGGVSTATVIGTVVQELDPSDNVIFQWRSWDDIPITDANDDIDLTTDNIDATHVNSVEWDHDGNILMSNRHLDEITKLNRRTGQIIWRLGGKKNQFTFINEDRQPLPFSHQHDARRLPNGNLTLYDNGNTFESPYSRAVEYQIDEDNKVITKVWEYRHQPDDIFAPATGNVQRLDNGNTIVGWGGATVGGIQRPVLTEVKPDGSKAFELYFADLESSYRVFRYPWSGQPTDPPTLVRRNNTLHYSWNGATHIEAYHVYGGRTIEPATLITTVAKTSFETTNAISDSQPGCYYYRIMPLDESGKETIYSNVVFGGNDQCQGLVKVVTDTLITELFANPQSKALVTTTLTIPSQAISQTVDLIYTDMVSPTQALPTDWTFANMAFRLEAYQQGNPVSDFDLNQPLTIALNYLATSLDGLNPASLELYYWDELAQAWRNEGLTIIDRDAEQQRLIATTNRLGQFVVLGKYSAVNIVQDGGFEAGPESSYWLQNTTNTSLICGFFCSYDGIPQSYRGNHWLQFRGSSTPEQASIQQTLDLPTGDIQQATLSLWLRIRQSNNSGNDVFRVWLDETELFTVTDVAISGYQKYTPLTLDVTPYLTATSHLNFQASIEANSRTVFQVDEVSLSVEGVFDTEANNVYLPVIQK